VEDATVAVNEDATQVIEDHKPNKAAANIDQTVEITDETVVITEDATQVIADCKSSKTATNIEQTVAITDETVAITEDATQVISETSLKAGPVADDATQVFEDIDNVKTGKAKVITTDDATQVIEKGVNTKESSEASEPLFLEDQTQVFDDRIDSKYPERLGKRTVKHVANIVAKVVETKVLDDGATQVIDATVDVTAGGDMATQVFDNARDVDKTSVRTDVKTSIEETQTFSEDETFDITAAATLATGCDTMVPSEPIVTANDSTQVITIVTCLKSEK